MPVVFRQGRFRFFFYSREGMPLEPVHIHVEGNEGTAKFWIRPVVELARNNGFNGRDIRMLTQIVADHADEIEERWNEHFSKDGGVR